MGQVRRFNLLVWIVQFAYQHSSLDICVQILVHTLRILISNASVLKMDFIVKMMFYHARNVHLVQITKLKRTVMWILTTFAGHVDGMKFDENLFACVD